MFVGSTPAVRQALVAVTLACGLSFWSAPARADRPSEGDALVHIHDILTLADHDYEGHRVKAKRAVDDACAAMHVDIRGDRHNLPGQHNSDELMHEADRELQDVRRVAAEHQQMQVLSNVDRAIQEVHFALHIR